ncbi:MAG: replication initiator protein [Arizlama microvirus]|nr:MAG: replication initiator protein [Arizlama microvirus]
MWAVRCYAESKCHAFNSFITLTYNEDNLPMHGSLKYKDFQRFMYRLRKKFGPVRFFMCGEYGENFDRPHYHALLFGLHFSDRVPANGLCSKDVVYRSESLEKLWPFGFSSIGEVNFATARYCATYCVKKVTGPLAEDHYKRVDTRTGEIVSVVPEFAHMSLRPGIGFNWLEQYWRDLYLRGYDAVIINGRKTRIPRYFDKKMDDIRPLLMDDVEFDRALRGMDRLEDRTFERLAVREQVEYARVNFNNERRSKVL